MAAATKVKVELQGKDNTAKAFKSAKKNADSFGSSIKSMLKVAAAAYAIKKAFDAVKDSLESLNQLNDIAQQAGVSAEWLQKFQGAMGQAGIRMDMSAAVTSIQKLNAALVNTEKIKAFEKLGIDVSHLQGMKPEQAFLGFLETVAAIPDEQMRLLALQRGLEEQGLRMAPLLRQGPDALRDSLGKVMELYPAVSDETVTLATNANNAFAMVGDSLSMIWDEALGSMMQMCEESFGGVDLVIMTTFERIKFVAYAIYDLFAAAFDSIKEIAGVFGQNIGDGFELIGRRVLQVLQMVARGWSYIAAGVTWLFNEAAGEALYEWADSIGRENERAIADIYARNSIDPTDTIEERWQQRYADYKENIQNWSDLLAAKKGLSTGAVPTEALENNFANAIAKGTKEGLAKGIEAGSYEALKASFKGAATSWSILKGGPDTATAEAAATNPTSVPAIAASSSVSATRTANASIIDQLKLILSELKGIASSTSSIARTAEAMEAI